MHFKDIIELDKSAKNVEEVRTDFLNEEGCLVTFTFELEDGSVETKTVLVEDVSCEELGL